MKKKYIQPNVSVSFVVVGSQLLGQSQYEGLEFGPGGIGGGLSKENNFSSWDYGFDEEDESESNSSSKSLWD
uniref:hypothetical protein n=1 Tax=Segatella hominis TaxID=2518605 RepID=UPI004028C08B